MVIQAFLGHQLFVGACFGDVTACHVENLGAVFDRRQPVSDDEGSPIFQKFLETFLQQFLGPGVDAGGRFIENQDLRIG